MGNPDWYDLKCVNCGKVTPHLTIHDKGLFKCMICDEQFGSQRPINVQHNVLKQISQKEHRKNMTRIIKSLKGYGT